jgi:hypothetical protein
MWQRVSDHWRRLLWATARLLDRRENQAIEECWPSGWAAPVKSHVLPATGPYLHSTWEADVPSQGLFLPSLQRLLSVALVVSVIAGVWICSNNAGMTKRSRSSFR